MNQLEKVKIFNNNIIMNQYIVLSWKDYDNCLEIFNKFNKNLLKEQNNIDKITFLINKLLNN